MPYLRHIVEQSLQNAVLQFASFLKGKDLHHNNYVIHFLIYYLQCLKCCASINFD